MSSNTIPTRCFRGPSDPQEKIGIHQEQDQEGLYVVAQPVECLESTASDAFTWLRATQEEIEREATDPEGYRNKYFRGGGRQYFIWESDRLKHIMKG